MRVQAFLVGTFAALCLAAQAQTGSIGQKLAQAAERANRSLPRMVAKNLRQDRVAVSGLTLTYTYTHLTYDLQALRALNLAQTQRPYILPELCSRSDTAQMLSEGVRFHYVYRDRNGNQGGELTLSKADC